MSRPVLAFPKPVRLEDPAYLRFIRRQPCILTGTASEAAHIVPPGHDKMGSKVSDYRTIPLSSTMHRAYHKLGRWSFEEKYNVDLDLEQLRFLEMYLSALKEGEDLGAR
jgi:hypothetical protein